MAIANASQIVHLIGSEIDGDHPHGDLDRISYVHATAGSGKIIRGYPLVYVLESLYYRTSVNSWADFGPLSTYTFAHSITEEDLRVARNTVNSIATHALSSTPGILDSSYSNLIATGSCKGLFLDYPDTINVSDLPSSRTTPPVHGDPLTPNYLVALESTLPYITTVAYDSGPSVSKGGTVLRSSGNILDTHPDDLPSWGYSGINYPESLFYDASNGDAWTGPSPSDVIASYSLRGGSNSPVASITAYLSLSVEYVPAEGSSQTKYLRYPVVATRSGNSFVFYGRDFGVDFIKDVASHCNFSLRIPEQIIDGEDTYGSSIEMRISNAYGSCLVVTFGDL